MRDILNVRDHVIEKVRLTMAEIRKGKEKEVKEPN